MNRTPPLSRNLVLIGGGHAHVEVLRRFGMAPQAGTRITLISRDVLTPYSGMLPGFMAGHYSLRETHVDLAPLCRFAGARLYPGSVTGLDPDARLIHCHGRPPIRYDAVSLDIGSTPRHGEIPGAAEHAIPVKPVDRFRAAIEGIDDTVLLERGRLRIVTIGGGAGGVEITLALHHRLSALLRNHGMPTDRLEFDIVSITREPLASHAPKVRAYMAATLQRRAVRFHAEARVREVTASAVRIEDGASLAADFILLVTDAAAPAWLRGTGLALDERGFIAVGRTMESRSHPGVFAAGDIAAFPQPLPKAGVFAVRQGPVLAENLAASLVGEPLRPYRPQRRALSLISTGDRNAIASWGPFAIEGAWVWRWKDYIDRKWMRRYERLEPMHAMEAPQEEEIAAPAVMPCAGCGSKVPADILMRALAEIGGVARDEILSGVESADDAAILQPPVGQLLVQSVDQFRAFIDDPYRLGRITAVHALSDLHALGATPHSALALVTLPYAVPALLEDDLVQALQGMSDALRAEGAALIGGHTAQGPDMVLGLSVNGFADADRLHTKQRIGSGRALLLTKALGTGAVLAGHMHGEAQAEWIRHALEAMEQSNAPAARILRAQGAEAITDVTGFGLIGHLEMLLRQSGLGAEIDTDDLPALPGLAQLARQGRISTLQPDNERFLPAAVSDPVLRCLLCDPQTAGGLLAVVPETQSPGALAALRDAGYADARIIGHTRDGPGIGLR